MDIEREDKKGARQKEREREEEKERERERERQPVYYNVSKS
jgi:hypothetical protein